jgi:hypothetical protein
MKRYEHYLGDLRERPDGEWVRWEDVEQLDAIGYAAASMVQRDLAKARAEKLLDYAQHKKGCALNCPCGCRKDTCTCGLAELEKEL